MFLIAMKLKNFRSRFSIGWERKEAEKSNAGREYLCGFVTENAREDKVQGKPSGEQMKIHAIGLVGLAKLEMQREQTLFPYCLIKKLEIKSFALPAAFFENVCLVSVHIWFLCSVSLYLDCYLESSRHLPALKPNWKNWIWILSAAPRLANQPSPINTALFLEKKRRVFKWKMRRSAGMW